MYCCGYSRVSMRKIEQGESKSVSRYSDETLGFCYNLWLRIFNICLLKCKYLKDKLVIIEFEVENP